MTKESRDWYTAQIIKYLQDATAFRLVDCMGDVPDNILLGLWEMIKADRARHMLHRAIADKVAQDVSVCVEGKPWLVTHCKGYVN